MPSETVDQFIAALESHGCKPRQHGEQWEARCPAHDDQRPSLSVSEGDDGRVLVTCHAGCSCTQVARALNLELRDLFPRKQQRRGEIVATYPYRDSGGRLLFEVVRFSPKSFSQRRPDGEEHWVWGLTADTYERNSRTGDWNRAKLDRVPKGERRQWPSVDRVLYRLPEIVRAVADGKPILIVEGEKDVHSLVDIGLEATTSPQGAGKWNHRFSQALRDADVIIVPDNDDAGRGHAQLIAASVHRVARSVKVLSLSGLKKGGDVSDWLKAGGTVEELQQLIADAPPWSPPLPADTTSGESNVVLDAMARFPLTDLGNAERLAARHGRDLRYCDPWGSWLVWDGRRWVTDTTRRIRSLAKDTVREIYKEASLFKDEGQRKRVASFAMGSESRSRITNMIELATSEEGIPVLSADLDQDPYLLTALNGTIDLHTGTLREHQRGDLITKLAPVEYDPEAECCAWEQFLSQVLSDAAVRDYVQKAVGYSLTGAVSEQCLFFLYGSGANGKSTFLTALLSVLGDYARQAAPDLLIRSRNDRHPTELADLRGMRFVPTVEVEEGRQFAEVLLKQLTGGDTITARYMHQDFFTFEPTHKLWLAANHKPIIRGTDHATWRRMRLIPFTVTIPEDEQDRQLREKLRAEQPGILRWAVEGCLEWQRDGLQPPEVVRGAVDEYREDMDTVGMFLSECCVDAAGSKATNQELRQSYERWCEQVGERPMSSRSLSLRLQERGYESFKTGGTRGFKGLEVVSSGTASTTPRDTWDGYEPISRFYDDSRRKTAKNREIASQASQASQGMLG